MVAVMGHLDVVPEGDGWRITPYEGVVKDGGIYGRGAMDDKGPVMASLYALYALKEAKLPLKRRIRLLFGLNEETGGSDMHYYLEHGGEVPVMGITPDADYPVINGEKGLITQTFRKSWNQTGAIRIGEISGGTAANIVPAHAYAELILPKEKREEILALVEEGISIRENLDGVRIEAEGISAHGGSPWEGVNAIGRLLHFLNRLSLEGEGKEVISLLAEKIGTEWNGESLGIAMEDEESGPLTCNLGVLRGNDKELMFKLNYRYPVTANREQCEPLVTKTMEKVGLISAEISFKEAIYMAPESDLVQLLLRVYREYTGEDAKPKCIGGGTYAKMMPNILAFGPIFPGDEVREHKPDEFMEIRRLVDNAKILSSAMAAMAGVEGE